MSTLIEKYQPIIDNAIKAVHRRTFYAQYPDHPKAYGEEAPVRGEQFFKNILGKNFEELLQTQPESWIGEEVSPYTMQELGVKYPKYTVPVLIENANAVRRLWKNVSVSERAAILVDALERIKERFFDITYATMHTTGQSFIMSFQASGPHSNDRALEAIALGYEELSKFPDHIFWTKPMGKFDITLEKVYKPVPKGVGLVIGCSTFPIWNSIPGIFANLITGNPVIVKPHPKAVLPIAIVVAEIQKALFDKDLSYNIIQLAIDSSDDLIAKDLAEHEDVQLIDYTGNSSFGDYIESLKGKAVFTEKAGVNSVILDSVDDINAVLQNLAFSVSLYSGQMCTAPQNFFIPEEGIKAGDTIISYDEVVQMLKSQVEGIANNPKMGPGTLGAIQNESTMKRAKDAKDIGGNLILPSTDIQNNEFENARVISPAIIEANADDNKVYESELFGPVMVIVKTKNTNHSIALAKEMAKKHGAITCAAYTTDPDIELMIYDEMEDTATPVTMNLTGFIWVNQHSAFSDFHVTGGNPAGNASFTNSDFINRRYTWIGHRKLKN